MSVAEDYRREADDVFASRSPLYAQWARGVADSAEVCALIESVPKPKRQTNLWLTATRFVHGEVPWSPSLMLNERVAEVVRTHATQTNEAGRCATLLPLLASLPQPLALLEIGASAGLCLLPDRYGYDLYRDGSGTRLGDGSPVLRCRYDGPVPMPAAVPEVVWRRGLDLNPLSVNDDADWLRALVWPGMTERAERLEAALATAALDPPTVVRGDLLTDLGPLATSAPPGATLVVFHTAVVAYIEPDRRPDALAAIRATGARWISNEGARVWRGLLPDADADENGEFVLRLDGDAVARTDGHGGHLTWL
jgi:hypothetical protein